MTEDYKENLLEYLTNTMQFTTEESTTIGAGKYDIVKEGSISTDIGTSMFVFIAQLLLEVDRSDIRINGMLQINNSSTKVIYGGYSKTDGSNTSEGFLILIDGDYNGITMLREYESGTRIREVQYLAQDEENNIYGVVGDTKRENEQKYFTMLNNFTIPNNGNYTLTLRKNYSLSDVYFRCTDITKKGGEAEYLIVGADVDSSGGARGINFKINVGAANEITRLYNRNSIPYNAYAIYSNYDADGNPYMKIVANTVMGDDTKVNLYKNYNGTTSSSNIFDYDEFIIMADEYKLKTAKDNDGGFYFRLHIYDAFDYSVHNYALYYMDSSNTIHMIDATYSSDIQFAYTVIPNGWIDENNDGNPFIVRYAHFTYEEDGDEVNEIELAGFALPSPYEPVSAWHDICSTVMRPTTWNYDFNNFLITLSTRDFNLLSIFTIQSDISNDSPANLLTILKRPGLQLNNQKTHEMFQPKYVDIINDNEIKFSRNIYDSVVYSNISVDSVQVPYNYLNNMELEGQNLYGAKNLQFIEDTTNWSKNRYENLDINFINKINVSNRDKNESMLTQAVSLNNSIHGYIDLNVGTASVLFEDGTSTEIQATWKPLTQYTYQITLNTNEAKKITGVDWTNTLNGMEFITMFDTPLTTGSHTIKQKVTINNEFYKTNLLYNGIQVQYNGQDVLVQSEEE